MNLFELFVKIGVDDQASGKLKDLGSKLGNGLKTAAKIGTAAVGAAAAGITALTTAAVNNYAEYEQLVGGVDTLFKDASQKVQKYAADAYKTAGMSANDYMANATAFSASLISSLGGDTEKAAEYANRAMVSMSDNANKMGTSLDSIVQTYQSLSRGNFAMLDNLKLGYGGTKAELERLIADAASYTEIQKEMGITVDASSTSFDNIVNAIAVVQGKLGIAGATAEEAATTIEGSILSMKAAWSNWVTSLADDNANVQQTTQQLIDSVITTANNILPAVQTILTTLISSLQTELPTIINTIIEFLTSNLPQITAAGVQLLLALVTGIVNAIPDLIAAIPELVAAIVDTLAASWPQIQEAGRGAFNALWQGIQGVWNNIVGWFQSVWSSLFGNLRVNVSGGGPGAASPKANGISYVPYDGYYSLLHEGERVLTAAENKAYTQRINPESAPNGSRDIVINMTYELDGAVLARKLYRHNQAVTNDHGLSFVKGVTQYG